MYIILQRNGYAFASDGPEYVITFNNEVIFRDYHKGRVEAKFMELSK